MSAGCFHHRGRLLAAGHLPRRLAGIDRVLVDPNALISPLVLEMLASAGIPLVREGQDGVVGNPLAVRGASPIGHVPDPPKGHLLVAAEVAYEVVERATSEAARGGKCPGRAEIKSWDNGSAGWGDWLSADQSRRLVHFGPNPELVASVCMLRWAISAASVQSVAQASRALAGFGPRLLAVEMPGRTLFEARYLIGLMTTQGGV